MTTAHRSTRGRLARVLASLACGWCAAAAGPLPAQRAPPPAQRFGQADPWQETGRARPRPNPEAVLARQFATGAVPQPAPNGEEPSLLPLMIEEQKLLTVYGPEHPRVLSVRERIRAVRDYLERHPPSPPARPEPRPAPLVSVAVTASAGAGEVYKGEPLPCPEHHPPSPPAGFGQAHQVELLPTTLVVHPAVVAAAAQERASRAAAPPAPVIPPPPAREADQRAPGTYRYEPGEPEPCPVCGRARTDLAPASAPACSPGTPAPAGAPDQALEPDGGQGSHPAPFSSGKPSRSLPGGVGTLLAGLAACLAAFLAALSVILRWHGKWLARQIRAELAGVPVASWKPATQAAPAPAPPSASPPRPDPATVAEPDPGTAEPFELGPTYEEERRLRLAAEAQREEALLRQIFEENLRLRQRLAQPGLQAG